MEDQGQMNHLSGFETQHHHQVHHCHKCGWPFPKPHPSAKHRRAHKKICGTVEGYKLPDTSNTVVSDDDHSDDGDYKSPQISFKRLERSPSEDDVFSDAVSNFADASLNSGVRASPEIASESAYSVEKVSEVPEFGASAEGTPAGNLTSSVTVQAPMIASTVAGGSGKRSDSGDLSSTIVAETQFSSPEGASKVHETDATTEVSPNVERKVIEEINDTPDAAESMLQATDIADPKEEFAQSVETHNGKLVSETPHADISPEHLAVQESEGADSGDAVEHNGKAGEEVHLFHVPHDAPAVDHPEKIIEGFKDHPKKEDVQPDDFEFQVEHSQSVGEYNRIKEEDSKVNVFSVPQEVPVLVNEEKIIAGFKDYKKMGWVGHDNRDLPNAVEEKGEISCLASDVLLEKDGLISNPIDQEVEVEQVTAAAHESQQLDEPDKLREALDDAKKKGIPDEEASLEDVALRTSGEIDSNMHVKPAEEVISYASEEEEDVRSRNIPCVEVHAVPDSVSVIEATTHNAEAGVIKEEEVTDVVKSLSDTVSLDNGAPRTTNLDRKDDSTDSNSEVEIVSTGDIIRDKNVEESLSSEALSAVEDGCVNESCVGIHHPTLADSETVTGAEAILKGSAEEGEVSGTVVDTTRTLSLDAEGDNTISTVVTSEFDGSKEDVEKLSRDVDNGTKAEEESSVGLLHSRVVGDSAASEIGIVHVAEDGGVRKEAAAEESSVQSSLLAAKSSYDDSVVIMQNREVAVVESRRKSAEEDANETITDGGGLEAETTTVVVDEVSAENEKLKKGEEVEGSTSMNELGHEVEKEAALLSVGVTQVPNSVTTIEEGGYEASLQSEDGTKPQQQLTASVLDASSSRSESLDANWGSVSVLSTLSDTIIPSDEPREVGKPNTQQQQASVETAVRQPDKLETSFEAPSLVESSSVSQRQFLTTQAAAAAGADYSPGRKKKEEIIAKVTNWTAKQPQERSSSPLKNLLVEANRETKPISSLKENNDIAPTTKLEEEKQNDSVKDNGAAAAAAASSTVASILTEAKGGAAISEEWNSPARYPTEIKREKKAKSRPYWAQFVCCTSGSN